jgi:GINS complex subunit 2
MQNKKDSTLVSAREVAFIAEQELIYVLPRYTLGPLDLVSGKIPKLRALQRSQIPLWTAILLKKQGKCNIMPPVWMSVDLLKEAHSKELRLKDKPVDLATLGLPWTWPTTAAILLDIASDDLIDSPHLIRAALQDLREVRMLKARHLLAKVDAKSDMVDISGLSLTEISEIRGFLISEVAQLQSLGEDDEEDEDEEQEGQDGGDIGAGDDFRYSNERNDQTDLFDARHHGSSHAPSDGFADNILPSEMSGIDTETTLENTLVDHERSANNSTANAQPSKRRRVDRRAPATTAGDADSDSDSDVEYRA